MGGTLIWMQCGACGGDSMKLLGIERPTLPDLVEQGRLDLLWHPSLSTGDAADFDALVHAVVADEQPLDVLCVEGAVMRGPSGTGMFDTRHGRPKKELVSALAARARVVVAVGTCAAYGGIPAAQGHEAVGLQFLRETPGGLLGAAFRSRAGCPVINLPGCPVHGLALADVLTALLGGHIPDLDALGRPNDWYGGLVHQGCSRNEYHEFRVEERDFGRPGCLFFHLGCLGPLTYGPCNKHHESAHGSMIRAGVPCVGCMRPDFPRAQPFFRTRNLEGVPLDLPLGVDRAHFLAYKVMAAAAAPERLVSREMRI